MSFKEFDLTEYIEALECFKNNNTEDVIKHWGSVEIFDLFIHKIKEDEDNVAKLAIKEFGSIEKYTEAMKYNLEHFSENMEEKLSGETGEILQRNNELYTELTAHMEKTFPPLKSSALSMISSPTPRNICIPQRWGMIIGI